MNEGIIFLIKMFVKLYEIKIRYLIRSGQYVDFFSQCAMEICTFKVIVTVSTGALRL